MEDTTKRFGLKIEFEPLTENPSRVFAAMKELIDTVEDYNSLLSDVISAEIKSSLVLQDIESGSVSSWLNQKILKQGTTPLKDDEAEDRIEEFLSGSNRELFQSVSGDSGKIDYRKVKDLVDRLNEMARETDALQIDSYGNVPVKDIVDFLKRLQQAMDRLRPGDRASYIPGDGSEIYINPNVRVNEEEIMDEMTSTKITNVNDMILKVKKPDYLGESQWDFKHKSGQFRARIEDSQWLADFQRQEINLGPGDSIRAKVEITVRYDSDGDVINENRVVLEVLNVIRSNRGGQQTNLP